MEILYKFCDDLRVIHRLYAMLLLECVLYICIAGMLYWGTGAGIKQNTSIYYLIIDCNKGYGCTGRSMRNILEKKLMI